MRARLSFEESRCHTAEGCASGDSDRCTPRPAAVTLDIAREGGGVVRSARLLGGFTVADPVAARMPQLRLRPAARQPMAPLTARGLVRRAPSPDWLASIGRG